MKYKGFMISQLDNGHWIGQYENITTPMLPYEGAVKMWVRNYFKKVV